MKEASNGLSLLFMVERWDRMAFLITIIYTSFFTGKLNEVCNILNTIIGSDNGLVPTRRQAIIWNKSVCYDMIIKSEKKGNIRRPIFALYPTQWCIQTQWPVWRKPRESMCFQLPTTKHWLPLLVLLAKLVSRDQCLCICSSFSFVASFAISHDAITDS